MVKKYDVQITGPVYNEKITLLHGDTPILVVDRHEANGIVFLLDAAIQDISSNRHEFETKHQEKD